MTAPAPALQTVIPDLAGTALDEIAGDRADVLARAVALYRERMAQDGVPLSSFTARI